MVPARHSFLFALLLLLGACEGADRPAALKALDGMAPSAVEHPASFIEATKVAVLERRPVALWEALPPSYQADVQGLLHDFGQHMDQEFWAQGMRMTRKLARVLQEKEELLLQTPLVTGMLAQAPDAADGGETLSRWGGLLQSIVDSEFGDLSRLQDMDVQEFLEGSGAALIQQLLSYSEMLMGSEMATTMDKVESMRVLVKDLEGNRALVQVSAEGELPTEEVFEQVEGRWVPAVLAAEWSGSMQGFRSWMDQVGKAEDREETLAFLAALEESLDQMLVAEDAQKLQGILTKVAFQFMAQAAASAPAGNEDG